MGRIIVPGEPTPERAAPLFSTALVGAEFLKALTRKSAWDTMTRISQLRATMPRRDDGRQDERR